MRTDPQKYKGGNQYYFTEDAAVHEPKINTRDNVWMQKSRKRDIGY